MRIFPGFTNRALTFLRALKRNNRREWFQEHRPEYEEHVLAPMRLLVEELDVRFARFAPEIVADVKRAIFRIHRDVRFSKDKSPYKTHASCWFAHRNASHNVGSEAHGGSAGYYFHLEPGSSFIAAGIWMPPRPALNRLREAIAREPADFARRLSGTALKRRAGGLNAEGMLTRLPRGFEAGGPAERWLRYTSFTVSAPMTDRQILDPRLGELIERDYRLMLPLVRWLNQALGHQPMERR
jgi:uncharacterized protein (TIGR02453 family)